MKRKIVLYGGYAPDAYCVDTVSSNEYCSGSETALMRVAEELAKNNDNEVIVVTRPIIEGTFRSVKHMDFDTYAEYQKYNEIDVLIVSRYINYILDFKMAKKNYLWLHDTSIHPWWKHNKMNHIAIGQNTYKLFDAIICVSNWHRDYVIDQYCTDAQDMEMFKCIRNGIVLDNFYEIDLSKKQKAKIVFNCRKSGLQEAVNFINEYRKYVPEAELHVFGANIGLEDIEGDLTNVFDRGYVSNKEIIDELATAEYWINPSTFIETSCIAAIEAQLCKAIPIILPLGGLKETTASYFEVDDPNLMHNLTEFGVTYGNVDDVIETNYNHAAKHTWENTAAQFSKLFS
jgi:hypothetical protein